MNGRVVSEGYYTRLVMWVGVKYKVNRAEDEVPDNPRMAVLVSVGATLCWNFGWFDMIRAAANKESKHNPQAAAVNSRRTAVEVSVTRYVHTRLQRTRLFLGLTQFHVVVLTSSIQLVQPHQDKQRHWTYFDKRPHDC